MTDGVGFVAGLKICGGAATASLGRSGRGTENKKFNETFVVSNSLRSFYLWFYLQHVRLTDSLPIESPMADPAWPISICCLLEDRFAAA